MTIDEPNPYLGYARSFQALMEDGQNLPYGGFQPSPKATINKNAPVVLVLSPHPDDECIIGGLPLRLMKEGDFRVLNVAITHGSNPTRKQERLNELKDACEWIGFELIQTGPNGLDRIRPETSSESPTQWSDSVNILKGIFLKHQPVAIFVPHARDWNQTHLGTHLLAIDALKKAKGLYPLIIETEYWGQMPHPNLMVENTVEEVADLLGALSHHRGELERNPFHLRLPAWMQDNVRRGAEVVGGQGGDAPDFGFATLYRMNRWEGEKLTPAWSGGKMLGSSECSKQSLLKA
jgi:LmbE family N-acetylglucosaminyl deacetylase